MDTHAWESLPFRELLIHRLRQLEHSSSVLLQSEIRPGNDGVPILHTESYTYCHLLKKATDMCGALETTFSRCFVSLEDKASSRCFVVGILVERSAAYILSVLAVVFAGAAFLPLDPSWPISRLQDVVKGAAPVVLVHAGPIPQWARDMELETVAVPELSQTFIHKLTVPSASSGAFGPADHSNPRGQARAPLLPPYCYVMYTSGSTGEPVGVQGTAEGILNRCTWMEQQYPWDAGEVACFKTSPCFVDSVWEIFGPLLAGISLLILSRQVVSDPAQCLQALAQHRVSRFVAVPSLLRALASHLLRAALGAHEQQEALQTALKVLISSGEPLPPDLVRDLQALLPRTRLLNLYGSTEVAADCTCCDVTHWAAPGPGVDSISALVPVGSPLSRTAVAVVGLLPEEETEDGDERERDGSVVPRRKPAFQPCEVGTWGEVWVAGAGVARGYHRQPAKTRDSFTPVPVAAIQRTAALLLTGPDWDTWLAEKRSDSAGGLQIPFFRTGDMGMMVPGGGQLLVRGRHDLQVKVQGVRVDLNELEEVLERHPSVHLAAARTWPGPNLQGNRLVAYVEPASDQRPPQASELLARCSARLPRAACPTVVYTIPRLPRSAAGKLQRSELPPPEWLNSELTQGTTTQTELQDAAGGLSHVSASGARPSDRAAAFANAAHVSTRLEDRFAGSEQSRAPRASESAVLSAFARTLGNARLEPTADFFRAGGGSLQAADAANALEIPTQLIVEYPTARRLAAILSGSSPAPSSAVAPPGLLLHAESGGREHQHSKARPAKRRRIVLPEKLPRPPGSLFSQPAAASHSDQQAGQALGDNSNGFLGSGNAAQALHGNPDPQRCSVVLGRCGHAEIRHALDCLHSSATSNRASAAAVVSSPALTGPASGLAVSDVLLATPWQLIQGTAGVPLRADPAGGRLVRRQLECLWRVPMRECVDASPVILLQPPRCPCEAQAAECAAEAPFGAGQGSSRSRLSGAGIAPAAGADGGVERGASRTWPGSAAEQAVAATQGVTCAAPYERGEGPAAYREEASQAAARAFERPPAPGHAADQAPGAEPAAPPGPAPWYAFTCCHGGLVRCIKGGSGALLWSAEVGGRAEAGLAVTACLRYIAVACSDGLMHFLHISTGRLAGECSVGGPIRAAPAVDPWQGFLWVATHARRMWLVATSSQHSAEPLDWPMPGALPAKLGAAVPAATGLGEACLKEATGLGSEPGGDCSAAGDAPASPRIVWSFECEGASSTVVMFDAARRRAYLTTLAGRVYAFEVADAAAGAAAGDAKQEAGSPIAAPLVRLVWEQRMPAAVFSAPAVDATSGRLVVAAVDGSLAALSTSGSTLWRISLGSPTFAPLCLLPLTGLRAPAVLVAVPSQDGILRLVEAEQGEVVGSHTLGAASSTGPTLFAAPDRAATADQSTESTACDGTPWGSSVVCCTNDGAILLLGILEKASGRVERLRLTIVEEATVQMPGEVFSSLVAVGRSLVMGCRDGFLYCLQL